MLLPCVWLSDRLGAGESSTQVTPFLPGGVSDGNWHTIHIHYYNKVGLGVILSAFSAVYVQSHFYIWAMFWHHTADEFDSLESPSLLFMRSGLYQGCNRSIKMPSNLLHLMLHTPRPLKQTYKSPLALGGVYGIFTAMLGLKHKGRRQYNHTGMDAF